MALPESMDPATCRNCGATGVEEYCPRCGQARRDHRRRISSLIGELLDELSLSGRIFTTLRMLVAHPGMLTADWIQGRRAAYISPVRLYILASVVFFSSAFFLGPPWSDRLPSVGDLGFAFDAAPSALASTVISGRLQTLLTLGVLLLVPLVALLLRVLYARTRFLLVDHLVFSLHLHAFTLFALTLLYGLVSLTRTPMPDFMGVLLLIAGLVVLAAPVVHLIAALGRVYGRVGWSRTVRAVVMVGAWGFAVGQLGNFAFTRAEAMGGTTLGEIHLVLGRHDYAGMVEARHAGDPAAADHLRDRALRELVFARSAGGRLGAYDLYALAEIRAARGDTPIARELLQEALQRSPDHPFALGLAARLVQQAGDTAASAAYRSRLLEGGMPRVPMGPAERAVLAGYFEEARAAGPR